MRAVFTKNSEHLEDVKKILNGNNIEYREFDDGTGNAEIRVDLSELEQKELDLLKEKYSYNLTYDLNDYDYLIFWN